MNQAFSSFPICISSSVILRCRPRSCCCSAVFSPLRAVICCWILLFSAFWKLKCLFLNQFHISYISYSMRTSSLDRVFLTSDVFMVSTDSRVSFSLLSTWTSFLWLLSSLEILRICCWNYQLPYLERLQLALQRCWVPVVGRRLIQLVCFPHCAGVLHQIKIMLNYIRNRIDRPFQPWLFYMGKQSVEEPTTQNKKSKATRLVQKEEEPTDSHPRSWKTVTIVWWRMQSSTLVTSPMDSSNNRSSPISTSSVLSSQSKSAVLRRLRMLKSDCSIKRLWICAVLVPRGCSNCGVDDA